MDPLLSEFPQAWRDVLSSWLPSGELEATFERIGSALRAECAAHEVLPARRFIFRALRDTPPRDVRVVILGQDPYIRPEQAVGLAFAVPPGVASPPSLANVLRELRDDLGPEACPDSDLSPWAEQGVLLLNAVLTVRRGESLSHAHMGWEALTMAVLSFLASEPGPRVFMLWGRRAQALEPKRLVGPKLILRAAHPSPLSARRGFFGCRHFSQANAFLLAHGQHVVNW